MKSLVQKLVITIGVLILFGITEFIVTPKATTELELSHGVTGAKSSRAKSSGLIPNIDRNVVVVSSKGLEGREVFTRAKNPNFRASLGDSIPEYIEKWVPLSTTNELTIDRELLVVREELIDAMRKPGEIVDKAIKDANKDLEGRLRKDVIASIDKLPQRLLNTEVKAPLVLAVSADLKPQIEALQKQLQADRLQIDELKKQIDELKKKR